MWLLFFVRHYIPVTVISVLFPSPIFKPSFCTSLCIRRITTSSWISLNHSHTIQPNVTKNIILGTRTRREVSSAKTGSSKATPNPPKTADKASKPKEDKVWMQPKASSQDQPKTEPSKPIGKPVTIPPTNNPTPAERKPKDSVAKPIAVKVTEIAPKTEEEPLLVFATCTPTNGKK